MRVKILSSTSTFNGVSYNTRKIQNQKGELMKHVNFGYLNHSENVTPSELKAFLKAHSQTNSRASLDNLLAGDEQVEIGSKAVKNMPLIDTGVVDLPERVGNYDERRKTEAWRECLRIDWHSCLMYQILKPLFITS